MLLLLCVCFFSLLAKHNDATHACVPPLTCIHVLPTQSLSSAVGDSRALRKTSVLDIFGFEFFSVNRFEQFCINYANEKLQQYFVDFVFKLEQAEYVAEGIDWQQVEFKDNRECLSLIEAKPTGVLAILNEACIAPAASDHDFACQAREKLAGIPHFGAPKMPHTSFVIEHYAGQVMYTTDGFVDANRDLLQPALIDLMMSSQSRYVQELFINVESSDPSPHASSSSFSTSYGVGDAHEVGHESRDAHASSRARGGMLRGTRAGPSGRSTIIFKSITTQFRNQLGALVAAIRHTSPHFVRCINPNAQRSPIFFDTMACLEQLRCGGVMDAVHVTRSGFGSRYVYADFIARFHCCAPLAADGCDGSQVQIAAALIRAMGMREDMFRLGSSKMFLRHHVIELLEVRRSELLRQFVARLQCAWRRCCSHRQMKVRLCSHPLVEQCLVPSHQTTCCIPDISLRLFLTTASLVPNLFACGLSCWCVWRGVCMRIEGGLLNQILDRGRVFGVCVCLCQSVFGMSSLE